MCPTVSQNKIAQLCIKTRMPNCLSKHECPIVCHNTNAQLCIKTRMPKCVSKHECFLYTFISSVSTIASKRSFCELSELRCVCVCVFPGIPLSSCPLAPVRIAPPSTSRDGGERYTLGSGCLLAETQRHVPCMRLPLVAPVYCGIPTCLVLIKP